MKLEDLRREWSALVQMRDEEIQFVKLAHAPKIDALKSQIVRMEKKLYKAQRRAAENMR